MSQMMHDTSACSSAMKNLFPEVKTEAEDNGFDEPTGEATVIVTKVNQSIQLNRVIYLIDAMFINTIDYKQLSLLSLLQIKQAHTNGKAHWETVDSKP